MKHLILLTPSQAAAPCRMAMFHPSDPKEA